MCKVIVFEDAFLAISTCVSCSYALIVEFPCFDVFEISHSCWRMLPKFQMLMVHFELLFFQWKETRTYPQNKGMWKQRRDQYQVPLFIGISIALQQPWPQNSLGYLEDIPSANSCSREAPCNLLGAGAFFWQGIVTIHLDWPQLSKILVCYTRGRPCHQGVSLWNWGFRQEGLTLDKNEESGVHIRNIMVS